MAFHVQVYLAGEYLQAPSVQKLAAPRVRDPRLQAFSLTAQDFSRSIELIVDGLASGRGKELRREVAEMAKLDAKLGPRSLNLTSLGKDVPGLVECVVEELWELNEWLTKKLKKEW